MSGFWAKLRAFIVVTLVTGLIWVFAEAETLRSVDARVEVLFETEPASTRTVQLVEPSLTRGVPLRVDVTLRGAAASMDGIDRLLRNPVVIAPGQDGLPGAAGDYTVNLTDVLQSTFRRRGISVRAAAPETVRVVVDDLVTREIRVELDVPPGALLDASPELRTRMVKVTLPAREAAQIPENATAKAKLTDEVLARLVPGRRETLSNLAIELPAPLTSGPLVRLEPSEATAVVGVRARSGTIKVASVPVHVRVAPGELSRWNIEIPEQDRFLTDVSVTGPNEIIRQVEDKSLPLVAVVTLSFEELERGIPSKEAVFTDLPTSLRFEVTSRAVRLKITRRQDEPLR